MTDDPFAYDEKPEEPPCTGCEALPDEPCALSCPRQRSRHIREAMEDDREPEVA